MKRIVALTDFSEVTSDLINLAGKVARATGAGLILLHVAMPDSDIVNGKERVDHSREGIAAELKRRHHELQVLQLVLEKLGVDVMPLLVRSDSPRGNPVPKIVEELERLGPDLVVMGSHGHGRLYELLVGSVTAAVVRRARRPILLVPSPREER